MRDRRIIKYVAPDRLPDGTWDYADAFQWLIDRYAVEILSDLNPGVYTISKPLVVKSGYGAKGDLHDG